MSLNARETRAEVVVRQATQAMLVCKVRCDTTWRVGAGRACVPVLAVAFPSVTTAVTTTALSIAQICTSQMAAVHASSRNNCAEVPRVQTLTNAGVVHL